MPKQRRRIVAQVEGNLLGRGAFKGRPAGNEIKEGTPEAVDVGPDVYRVTVAGLLGGQVIGRAEHPVSQDLLALFLLKPGQAQVEDLDGAGAVHDQVAGLDVAVDQAGLVGVLQSESGLADEMGCHPEGQRTLSLDDLVERPAVHILHYQEMQIVVVVEVIGADDVGMLQGSDRPRPRGGTV